MQMGKPYSVSGFYNLAVVEFAGLTLKQFFAYFWLVCVWIGNFCILDPLYLSVLSG
jgi:hypothetical protein